MTAMSKADFKVGDKVRTTTDAGRTEGFVRGKTGVVRPDCAGGCAYVHVAIHPDSESSFPFDPSEIELVEPATPTFSFGDRVELAGVQGDVTYVYKNSKAVDVKWSETETSVINGPILSQLKKIEPEQVFITGAWYKSTGPGLDISLFRLLPTGWQQVCISDTLISTTQSTSLPERILDSLVEVDFPL